MAEGSGKNVHAGHRSRVRQRFLEFGGEQLQDHQLLELILFYAIPQRDVNPLAHELIGRFGSLQGVLEASREELKETVGITDNTVALLKLFPEVTRRAVRAQNSVGVIVNTTEEAAELLHRGKLSVQDL